MTFSNSAPTPSFQQRFTEANRLYDNGRFVEAAVAFENLLQEGWLASEIFFNLGNAYFKAQKLGSALLNYRRAWYLAPRDPDIRANLQYALQTAGAPASDLKAFEAAVTQLSHHQWVMLATIFWWGACALSAGAIWTRRQRSFVLRSIVGCMAALLISLAGIWVWQRLATNPEHVVMVSRQEVRFAPLDTAVLHFSLPEGALVREIERSGEWVKITADRKEGWVRASGLTPVYTRGSGPRLF